jgi:hypothetical protein
MSEQFSTHPFDDQLRRASEFNREARTPVRLPVWLARRSLARDERVTAVYGPSFSPSWERYVTHPGLFLLALVLGAVAVGMGSLLAAQSPDALALGGIVAGGLFFGSVFVLGISCGYFTRLVITNFRIFVVQGYEVCKSWDIDFLPRSLLRYTTTEDGEERPAVDLKTVQTMLGASSNQVADAKTILSFGKKLDHIKARDRHGP